MAMNTSTWSGSPRGRVKRSSLTFSATSINSATWADYAFTVTATSLGPGDLLDFRIVVDITDSATGSGVIADIGEVAFLASIKG